MPNIFMTNLFATDNNSSKSDEASNGASLLSADECPNCRHLRSFHKKKYESLKDDKQYKCTYLEEYVIENHMFLDGKTRLKKYATRGCVCEFSPRDIDLNVGIGVNNPLKGEAF